MTRSSIGILLALLLVPALAVADPPRYMGDDGNYSPEKSYDRTGGNGASGTSATGSATNLVVRADRVAKPPQDDRTQPIVYQAWARNPDGSLVQPLTRTTVTIGVKPGSNPPIVSPTAAEWLAFLRDRLPRADGQADVDWNGVPDSQQGGTAKPLSTDPPRNALLVVDQGKRFDAISKGQNPEVPTQRLVTVVTRWVEAVPQYRNQRVVGYPCCCTITFSVLVGYTYVQHVDTTYQMVNVSDYPTTEIAVDRGIIISAGNPQYSTQIPRLCEFTYGVGAKYVAPVVPLITNVNDIPDLSQSTQTLSSQAAGTTQTLDNLTNVIQGGRRLQNVQEIRLWYDTAHRVVATQGTTNVALDGTVTTLTEPMTTPLVNGSGPGKTDYGGITVASGTTSRVIDPAGGDKGVFTNAGDKAFVVDALTAKSGSDNTPYDFHTK